MLRNGQTYRSDDYIQTDFTGSKVIAQNVLWDDCNEKMEEDCRKIDRIKKKTMEKLRKRPSNLILGKRIISARSRWFVTESGSISYD